MKLTKMKVAVLGAIAVQSGFIADTAYAQDGALEEIVITATRRETDVQDVPLAVTALTGDSLQQQNIENLEDLTGQVPNILIAGENRGTSNAQFNMRGIPNVGIYVDGIWQVSNQGLLTRDFVEIDRVEVLRGPQGTLYGRDSTGGSIHIHSKLPAEEFGINLNMQAGNFDRKDVTLSADVPISDNIRTKWTIGSYNNDGWVDSVITGLSGGAMDSEMFRGDIVWTPTDNLRLRLIHQEDNQVGREGRVQSLIDFRNSDYMGYQVGIAQAHDIASGGMFNSSTAQAGGAGLGKYESRMGSRSPNRQFLEQTALHVDYDINDTMHLKYMYGRTKNDSSVYLDWGGSEYNFFVNYDIYQTDIESHEFQLTGSLFNDSVDYVVGYYGWEQTQRNRGVEWSMADWVQSADMGNIKTLDYNDVLNHPVCTQRTPADAGFDFTGRLNLANFTVIDGNDSIDDWPMPCNWAGGNGWIGVFSGIGNTSDRLTEQSQDGDAWFGEVTWYVTDQFDLTLGYRRHEQDNVAASMSDQLLIDNIASGATAQRPFELDTEFTSMGHATSGGMDLFNPSSFSADTYRFAATYDFSDDVMVYAGYSEGFNSGGVSLYEDSVGQVQLSYSPEVIENWELGLRADLLDGALRANVTYFNTDWIGIQYLSTVQDRITGQDLTELVLQNSADGEAKGIEFELTYLATDRLTLNANLGFLDTAFTNITAQVPITTNTEFARAPETTYALMATYEWDFAGGDLVGMVQSNYWDEYWRSSTIELRQNAQGFVTNPPAGDVWMTNARLTWTPPEGNYSISLWGSNLTDEYNFNSGFMHAIWSFDFATVDRPREYGLQFKASF